MNEGDPGIRWTNPDEIKIDEKMLVPPETNLVGGDQTASSESVPVLTEVVS